MEKRRRKRRVVKNRRRRRGRKYQRNCRMVTFAAIIVLFIVGASYISAKSYVHKHIDERILNGITVGGTSVAGMTEAEAVNVVNEAIKAKGATTVQLKIEEDRSFTTTLNELGMTAGNVEDAVKNAVEYGKKGNAFRARKILKKSEKNMLEKDFPLDYILEETVASANLTEKVAESLQQPVNAFVTQNESGEVQVIEEKKGEVLNTEKTIQNLQKILAGDWEAAGVMADAVVEYSDPEITKKDLLDVTDVIGSYSTYYGIDGSGRSQNVETGASHINGTFLKPGETMSADEAMRPYTEENGYTEAGSYESNKVVQTMGGGICQVSSTLYNALLYAELEIVERYPHSMLVSYVEPSMDAAIADDLLDLVFKNNQKYPIYIESILANGTVTFNIYGKETRDPGRSLQFFSETTEGTVPEGKRFVATENVIGYIGLQSPAYPEITAQLWKIVLQNGEEESREVVNYSRYAEVPETYGVGTVSDSEEDTALINGAVETQDEATINAAIQSIRDRF